MNGSSPESLLALAGACSTRAYTRRRPEKSVLYGVVQRELRGFLRCGILAHGFLRVHCDGCGLDRVAHMLNDRPRQTLEWMKPSEKLAELLR